MIWFGAANNLLRDAALIALTLGVAVRGVAQTVYFIRQKKALAAIGAALPCLMAVLGYLWTPLVR